VNRTHVDTAPGFESALYEALLRHFKGRGGRTEATRVMRQYLSGHYSDSLGYYVQGFRAGRRSVEESTSSGAAE